MRFLLETMMPVFAVLVAAADALIGDTPSLVGQVGALGVLGWYLYYQNKVAAPRREKAQQEAIEKIVAIHASTVKETRDHYEVILLRIEKRAREDMQTITERLECRAPAASE